jgi:hypothetical protein
MDLIYTFLGPLPKKACIYFLLLTVIFFATLVFILFGFLVYLIKNLKNIKLNIAINMIILLFYIFLLYFVNRLLNNMCLNSL